MSSSFVNTQHSQSTTPESPPPDFTALAAVLQATIQTIQRYHGQAAPLELQANEKALPDESDSACSDDPGEIRCYHFSPSVLRHERELLKKYRVKDFRGLITETHTLLVGIVKLMKSAHPETRMNGQIISSLGCLLEQVSILTLRMQNVYTSVELVDAPVTV